MKYKLVQRDGLALPEGVPPIYSDDNTIEFSGPLGQHDDKGPLFIWANNQ